MPSFFAISQCGLPPFGAGVPQLRSVVCSSGTSGSGEFGTNNAFASSVVSICRSSDSSMVMRSPSFRRATVVASGSPPCLFATSASPRAASLRSALS